MSINFKFLLLGTSLSLTPTLVQVQCAVTDCQQLGYTSLKSCDGGLKCPFGEYWACSKVEEKAILDQCTGYAKNCKVGDILNSDGTCTTDKETGKEPLGVVIVIKDSCGWAMTAESIKSEIEWGGYGTDIPSLPNYTDWRDAAKDFDAAGNTRKIIQTGNSGTYPAAWAAVNYAPDAAPETKGKWVLPSAGMLNSLYANSEAIQNAIYKLGGSQLANAGHIWSSSEYGESSTWYHCPNSPNSGFLSTGAKYETEKYHDGYNIPIYDFSVVRPVLAF